ncbi:hypothetical protein [Erythrobacter sp. BLCC-B19]|uniref:hypothetical protein n=1 Tax=Erythrobacter sp. BLCC-B19 TaxID=3025315 RepID=UPI0023601349|nr:hypothetical protein [Erythrobacter sp. BLCC-B19]WDA40372.1 hypothetical protein PS060_12485 [Erythrobacter sp. BLCC-B19]
MESLIALAAPFALMLPMVAEGLGLAEEGAPPAIAAPQCQAEPPITDTAPPPPSPLSFLRQSSTARQVRIEQRVVVRIAPAAPGTRPNMLVDLPRREVAPRFEERGKEKCVPLDQIAGVQTGSGNRLVLFLRDRRMISVNLEKSCRARDFYSGFYVERNKDGRLCVERDKLQSRSGARCEVETMRQLVEVRS